MKLILEPDLAARLSALYDDMERAYDRVAEDLGHGCDGCPDNCCDSYFLHHTYIEWCYLWQGLERLSEAARGAVVERARAYLLESGRALARGRRPKVMCPLNERGRCLLYPFRLMVCRTHGVPASMTRPDGQSLSFPGCFRCQEIVERRGGESPRMERTVLLRRLVELEQELLRGKRHLAPKVKRSIAAMIVEGPPDLPHCQEVIRRVKDGFGT